MVETMSISVNGQSQVPPGFRFHPTEEELLQYYLRKRVSNIKIDLDVIRDVDLNKLEPWDIQERCKIGTTPQNDWYFFSHKDKKYPTGTRTNRATVAGFWKATGRDKAIHSNSRRNIGMRKTLVFYKGRAPHGQKSDWIMHEYRLHDSNTSSDTNVASVVEEASQEEGWVVCRIFKKKNLHKTLDSAIRSAHSTKPSQMFDNEDALDRLLEIMGRSCKEETNPDPFLKLPGLDSPKPSTYQPVIQEEDSRINNCHVSSNEDYSDPSFVTSWAALDRLVASQLNGPNTAYSVPAVDEGHLQLPTVRSSSSSSSLNRTANSYQWSVAEDYTSEIDLWSNTFVRTMSPLTSSSEPLCHVSNDSE